MKMSNFARQTGCSDWLAQGVEEEGESNELKIALLVSGLFSKHDYIYLR